MFSNIIRAAALCLTLNHGLAFQFAGVQKTMARPGMGLQSQMLHSSIDQHKRQPLSMSMTEEMGTEMEMQEDPRVPITVISGFLGAGKTTLLQHILENKEGLRVGMIVNDMAAVNVDAKLVRGMDLGPPAAGEEGGLAADTVELANGCVCCTMSEELFASVNQLMEVANQRGTDYDHLVIETTGIAEPRGIRDTFQDAAAYGMPVMEQVRLDTLVTVVDCGVFLDAYTSADKISQRPDLAEAPEGLTPEAAELPAGAGGSAQRAVVDLLIEQVECADILVLNKMDMVSEEKLALLKGIVRALNPKAAVVPATFGRIPYQTVLGCMQGMGVAELGVLDDHKEAIEAAEEAAAQLAAETAGHAHAHAHERAAEEEACGECGSTDPGHSHEHGHSHSHANAEPAEATTARVRFGITNFIYRRRRPFHPERLLAFLKNMPARESLILNEAVEAGSAEDADSELGQALSKLVRSKGFVWLANTDAAALYWSHAGAGFELKFLGRWWDSVPREGWPPGAEDAIMEDFEGEYGDRRQELVFIGLDLAAPGVRGVIERGLDACLVTEQEMATYAALRENGQALEKEFNGGMAVRF